MRVGAVTLAVAALVGCGDGGDDDASWPSVEVVAAAGDAVDTASWVGQPLVVNFWYSTCAPCVQEMEDFAAVDAEVGDEVRFIGVNPLDSAERMLDFAGDRGVTYDLFQDPLAELQGELDITSFPATYFVSASGEIVDVTAALDADELRAEIDDLLATDGA